LLGEESRSGEGDGVGGRVWAVLVEEFFGVVCCVQDDRRNNCDGKSGGNVNSNSWRYGLKCLCVVDEWSSSGSFTAFRMTAKTTAAAKKQLQLQLQLQKKTTAKEKQLPRKKTQTQLQPQ
jgi:hypothetical protein